MGEVKTLDEMTLEERREIVGFAEVTAAGRFREAYPYHEMWFTIRREDLTTMGAVRAVRDELMDRLLELRTAVQVVELMEPEGVTTAREGDDAARRRAGTRRDGVGSGVGDGAVGS